MEKYKDLEISFIIDLKSEINLEELNKIHKLILTNNKGININRFIYVCCQNIDEDIEIIKLKNNVKFIKIKDPGVIDIRADNFKMKNARRMFFKLLKI